MNKKDELKELELWYINKIQHIAQHNELYNFKRHEALRNLINEYKQKKHDVVIKYMN